MGSDDLFHKKKLRVAKTFHRKRAKRDPYDRVLIVCEGEKSEPIYFKKLRRDFGLNPANVVIAGKKRGLDPKRLVEYAVEEFNKDPDFNHVYCVFDRDKHLTYDAALEKIRATRLRKGASIHAITSIPCFEIWLLLHFTYTTRSFSASGNSSDCDLVVSELKRYISDYEKGDKEIFDKVNSKLGDAILGAKRLENFHETSGTDNPSSKVYLLVEYLKSLKR